MMPSISNTILMVRCWLLCLSLRPILKGLIEFDFCFFCFVNTLLICIMERYRNLCHDRWSNLFWSFNMLLIFWWLWYHSEMHKRTCLKVFIMQLTIQFFLLFRFLPVCACYFLFASLIGTFLMLRVRASSKFFVLNFLVLVSFTLSLH